MKQDKDKGKQLIRNSTAEFLIFTGQAGEQSFDILYEDVLTFLSLTFPAQLLFFVVGTVNNIPNKIFL